MFTSANACHTNEEIEALNKMPLLANPLLKFDLSHELEDLRRKESWERETGRSSVAACLASLPASCVWSHIPKPTPIFLRKSNGGVPPAKIHTKSLEISCCALHIDDHRFGFELDRHGIEQGLYFS